MTETDKPGHGRLSFAPAHHPPVPPAKIGLLLVNLGTPDATDYWSMRRYLNEFLSDKRVIDIPSWKWQPILQGIILTTRPKRSGAAYAGIWNKERNESPLLTITRAQTEKLAARMAETVGDGVIVDFAMRYGNPSTKSVIEKMHARGVERLVVFPLYPQYAGATTATANDQVFRALMEMKWQPALRTVPAYFEHPLYIDALAQSIEAMLAARRDEGRSAPDVIVASYHGLPERYLTAGDPYHCQCHKTTRLLRDRLGMEKSQIETTFQSRFGPEEWLKPYTVARVAELAKEGKTDIAVLAPGFSSDCVETLEEIQEEIKESFEHAGGKTFSYIPCLNDGEAHIAMMAAVAQRELAGWLGEDGGLRTD